MSSQLPPINASEDDWFDFCFHNPKSDLCTDVRSFYQFRMDLVPNAVFLAFFGASWLGYAATYALTRRGLAFNVAMMLGTLCEILGYAGRVMLWNNPWSENGFLVQICCLTIGPAFLAAGVYLCLRRIVYAFGKENSLIAPEWYTRFFIPCDVISLVLQALGGGMASVASHNNEPVDTGNNIMMAGLSFQVFTLLLFIIVSTLFGIRSTRRYRALGAAAFDQDPVVAKVRGSLSFRLFLGALTVATLAIFTRCVYRVAELSGGWDGELVGRQDLFVWLEGVMIVVACVVLNVFNPSFCFRELMEGGGGLGGCIPRRRKQMESVEGLREGKSAEGSVKGLKEGKSVEGSVSA